tara:strand:+ start:448 stop:795 length:348 start_codon:yes stop_codon:yes gene_type:complete
MAFINKTISSALTQVLIPAGSDYPNLNSLRITNTSPGDSPCKVDLYISSQNTGNFYLIKGKMIKAFESMILDNNSLKFNNKSRKDNLGNEISFSMNIKLTDPYSIVTPSVDIIIN